MKKTTACFLGLLFATGALQAQPVVTTTVVAQNTQNVDQPGKAHWILKLNILISGAANPVSATSFYLSRAGSTAPCSDVAATGAKLWYTGKTGTFDASTAQQVGSGNSACPTNLMFTGFTVPLTDTNYFWLSYDVNPGAAGGHCLDAEYLQVNLFGGVTGAFFPVTGSLPGCVEIGECAAPGNQSSAAVTSATAKLKWDKEPFAHRYDVWYRELGTTPWVKKKTSANAVFKNISGLMSQTGYEWKVRSLCSKTPKTFSPWSPKAVFVTTAPAPFQVFPEVPGASRKTGDAIVTEPALQILPNPAGQNFELQDRLPGEGSGHFQVLASDGRVVYEAALPAQRESLFVSLPAGAPPGIYQAVISCGDFISVKKIAVF
jgi:hypothetical protein